MSTTDQSAGVAQLHPGDTIHLAPHQVFRHTEYPHTVTCSEADVRVDCLLIVEGVIVICWHCGAACGATVYDAGDCVLRLGVAA